MSTISSVERTGLIQPFRTLQSEILIQFNARSLPIKERPYRFRIRDHEVIWIVLMITDKRRVRAKRFHASNIFMSQVQNQNKHLVFLFCCSDPSQALPYLVPMHSHLLYFISTTSQSRGYAHRLAVATIIYQLSKLKTVVNVRASSSCPPT